MHSKLQKILKLPSLTDYNRIHEEGLDIPGESSGNLDTSLSTLDVSKSDHTTLTATQPESSLNFPDNRTEQSVSEKAATETTIFESASPIEDLRWK